MLRGHAADSTGVSYASSADVDVPAVVATRTEIGCESGSVFGTRHTSDVEEDHKDIAQLGTKPAIKCYIGP